MPLVSMRELLDHAATHGYGIPAFNVNNLEQVQAVMAAADEVGAPVILQASAGARKYAGEAFIKHLIQAAAEMYPHIPLVMHQDHGTSPKVCQGAIDLGFGSVMMDGSLMEDGKTPSSVDYNVEVTRKVVEWRTRWASPWRVNWAAWATWKPVKPARKTALAPRASSTTARC